MPVPQPKGDPVTVHSDEGPRPDTTLEKLARLRAGLPRGRHGHGGQLLADQRRRRVPRAGDARSARRELGREPLARIVSTRRRRRRAALHGHRPDPGHAQGARRARGSTVGDIDLVELNEAFASQVLACVRELELDHDRLNVNGGAIALGHPLGCSGARLLGTLIWEMRRRGARCGLATMCIGVGQGLATVVENAVQRLIRARALTLTA